MNQIILFTPVGGTDPISSSNYHDGSVLHICRHYRPDKVILYMSKEMLDFQEEDDRYRYCLNKLAAMQNRTMEYEIIERRELTKVHEFDYFYQDFGKIIEKIYQEMDESDTLLLNVSSGTPAMKSGLLVMQTLAEFPAKLIQVATPDERINEHHHKNYDVEILWQLDADNEENAQNRCREVLCPTLEKLKKEEIIKKHVSSYDYRAALEVADTLSDSDTAAYYDLLYLASRRVLLDFQGVDKVEKGKDFSCIPVRSSNERKYFEYALNIDLRLRRGEYADFIRSITPLLVDLLELILKKQCGININQYCTKGRRNGKEYRRWAADKLKDTPLQKAFNDYFNKTFFAEDVYSIHLKVLIDYFSDDVHLKQLVDDVRKVEGNIRNLAAHEIVCVTDETIEKLTGFSAKTIMNKIRELFSYTGIAIRKDYWDSYDTMNRMIIKTMSL